MLHSFLSLNCVLYFTFHILMVLLVLQLLSPVNLQDVSGMHHMMARNFGEKSELDKVRVT